MPLSNREAYEVELKLELESIDPRFPIAAPSEYWVTVDKIRRAVPTGASQPFGYCILRLIDG